MKNYGSHAWIYIWEYMADVTVHNLKCLPALHTDGVAVNFPSAIVVLVALRSIISELVTVGLAGLAIAVVGDDDAATYELTDEYEFCLETHGQVVTSSRQITEVKLSRALLVLVWMTGALVILN